jgi:hypothetical protein
VVGVAPDRGWPAMPNEVDAAHTSSFDGGDRQSQAELLTAMGSPTSGAKSLTPAIDRRGLERTLAGNRGPRPSPLDVGE